MNLNARNAQSTAAFINKSKLLLRNRTISCHNTCLLMLFCAVCLTGCGSGVTETPRGDISGTVTFQETPVTEGTVNFFSGKTGIAAGAKLDEEGHFSIPDGIEIGSYMISITPPYVEEPPGLSSVESKPREFKNIPAKYRTGETSGLTAEVKSGENHYEFKMVQ
ncbi:hypothetical protein [Gimesia sp.]|uniref:hypothetical protein n=1 Tax=Gimesia sp. TaxID=2024833 RepID=UPI003A8E945C